MNIVLNNKRQEGRSILFRSNPAIGLLALTGFVDDNNGPQGPSDFIKTFRYSTNGVIFSEWIELTVLNITSIAVEEKSLLIIELAYFKNEPVGESVLEVTEAIITTTDASEIVKPYFENSIFKTYFNSNDQDVLNWYVNVLEKLYEKGLIPNYIERQDQYKNPEDFLALWGAVTRFFSYYVKYARVFSTFYNNRELVENFLKQRGLNTSPEDSLTDLDYLLERYNNQVALRGTNDIIRERQEDVSSGEFLRLIHHKDIDEFLFCLYKPQNFGWCLGHSSPLYRGLRNNDRLNKAPWSKGYVNIEGAEAFTNSGFIEYQDIDSDSDIESESDGENTVPVLKIDTDQLSVEAFDNAVIVDPNLDYEISFLIKLTEGATFDLSLIGYDKDGNIVGNKSRKTGLGTDVFVTGAKLSRSDKYVLVRYYLYNSETTPVTSDIGSIKQGKNLIANTALAKIGFNLSVSDIARIYDFRILPMLTEYSRGFVQVNNFISVWLKNRNTVYSIKELEDYVSQYLTPYNSHIKITSIGDFLYDDAGGNNDTTYWIGAGQYCRQIVWIGADPSCEVKNYIWVPEEETSYCEQS